VYLGILSLLSNAQKEGWRPLDRPLHIEKAS
jgi:hypothetical protein